MIIINDDARDMINQALKQENSNCLHVSVQNSCCGSSLMFELKKENLEDTKTINGVAVLMSREAEKLCEDKIIAVENNELVIHKQ